MRAMKAGAVELLTSSSTPATDSAIQMAIEGRAPVVAGPLKMT